MTLRLRSILRPKLRTFANGASFFGTNKSVEILPPKTHTHIYIYNRIYTPLHWDGRGCKWCFFGARSQSGANVDAQTTKTDKSNRTHYHSTSVHFLIFNVHVNELESIYIYIIIHTCGNHYCNMMVKRCYMYTHDHIWWLWCRFIIIWQLSSGFFGRFTTLSTWAQGPIQQLLVRDLQRIKLFNSSTHASARFPRSGFFRWFLRFGLLAPTNTGRLWIF